MRPATFLSASVPRIDRGLYHETANPFLIQLAVRELVVAIIRGRRLVWGGHPAITPMIRVVCESLDIDPGQAVTLYQSEFFRAHFPPDNEIFEDVVITPAVENDRCKSLLLMRSQMLSRNDIDSAVFVGGMEGVEDEYDIFKYYHKDGIAILLDAPGGAARELGNVHPDEKYVGVNFAGAFRSKLTV